MLSSFEIRNFRAFSHLMIERLGQVNLIVGKNNVGKTCLLEALRLYGSVWPPSTVFSILFEHNEIARPPDRQGIIPLFASLFHGRKIQKGMGIDLRCPELHDHTMHISASREDDLATRTIPPADRKSLDLPSWSAEATLVLEITSGARSFQVHESRAVSYDIPSGTPSSPSEPPFVRASSLSERVLAQWWDAIALTDSEARILETMRIIAPLEGISFVGHPSGQVERMAKIRVAGVASPIPMKSYGDGLMRVFQMALALEYGACRKQPDPKAESGLEELLDFLLIDEFENGIHHSVHAEVWKAVFQLARLRGVQVFATTHSWDCLRGFAEAVRDDADNDGVVVRLEKVEGEEQTGAVIIDREGLPIVIRDSIEVR